MHLRKWHRVYHALDLAEAKAREIHGWRPFPLIAWRDYSDIGGWEIDERYRWFLQGTLWKGAKPEQIEMEYKDAKRRYREALTAGKRWDRKAGIRPLRDEEERAKKAWRDASQCMARTQPTTAAGAAALLDYVRRDADDGETHWHSVALKTVVAALAKAGTRSL